MSAISGSPTRSTAGAMRGTSLAAGILYLLTFASIPTLALYAPFRTNAAEFVLGSGSETAVLWGAFLEVIVALANVGTAVVLFAVGKRQSETAALGFVTTRVLEGALILVGVASVLALVALRQGAADAGTEAIVAAANGKSLVAIYNGAFLVSQSLLPVFNDLLLGYILYRARLVPRIFPIVAFVGAPLLLISDIAIFFGVLDRGNPAVAAAAFPIALFELGLGIWLIVRGFNPKSPVLMSSAAGMPERG